MTQKMLIKYRQGLRGWDCPENESVIKNKLADNIKKNDWIDVANLAMMLHNFKKENNNEKK